jgi:phage gp29-like protein
MTDNVDQQKQPITNEIATVDKDITYLAFQGILRPQDDTLESRGAGKTYKIYDEIERDCKAFGLLQKRKLAVIGRPWQVDPASEDPLDVKAADMVRLALQSVGVPPEDDPGDIVHLPTSFDLVCYNLLDAILKGFAVGEIMWGHDPRNNMIVPRQVRARNQRRFNFDKEYRLRLKTWTQLIPGELLPPRKFIVHSVGAKDGSPYGLGLGSRLFWPVLFKRKDITFWLTFLDKFGSPTAVGKYPSGTSTTDQDKLLAALGAIAQDAGVTIPEGMIIELLEAKRSGTVSYEEFCRYMDEQMTFAILGDSPSAKGSGGGLAAAAIEREEVRLELIQADADLLSATLNATLSPWLTAFNCPGARPPKIWRQVKKAEDLKARSERDANVAGIGYRPTQAAIEEAYGGEWEPVAPIGAGLAETAPAKVTGKRAGQVPTDFAEGGETFPDQQALDDAIANLPAEQLQGAMQKAMQPVVRYLQQGGEPQEAMARLATVFPEMDTAFLENMLARAIFVAEIWGQLSAESER